MSDVAWVHTRFAEMKSFIRIMKFNPRLIIEDVLLLISKRRMHSVGIDGLYSQ